VDRVSVTEGLRGVSRIAGDFRFTARSFTCRGDGCLLKDRRNEQRGGEIERVR
jgi:hypothetical protein